jgi:hypothetical protein
MNHNASCIWIGGAARDERRHAARRRAALQNNLHQRLLVKGFDQKTKQCAFPALSVPAMTSRGRAEAIAKPVEFLPGAGAARAKARQACASSARQALHGSARAAARGRERSLLDRWQDDARRVSPPPNVMKEIDR